ncbi:mannose-6-phosphate isomerase, class I, partial [Isoptericola sp. NPDC057191]|uniref:mannose-6-phosphate isomerase, class I n=1 Tax=Isoptericola sp. NPDC057191 TaxID=3346041 RepID=UPI003632E8A6
WGSPTRIPDLLGHEPDGTPAAELWLGAHPAAPSRLRGPDGAGGPSLDDLVRAEPHAALGRRVADRFGPRLPYLLKVLAAERALSLQVHPRPHLARAGYHRETRAGLAAGDPRRSFHDDQHKPEMIVALSPFEALAGFRSPRSVLGLLDGLDGVLVDVVRAALTARPSTAGVRAATEALVAARRSPSCAADVVAAVDAVARRHRADAHGPTARADATVLALAAQHPGDPGALVSLLLNRVTLEPGEAMYVPAGEVHAYLSGFGVEVMAASDNVLRAGLTTKHVDAPALLECASFAPRPPARPATLVSGGESVVVTYRAPVEEFALTFADVVPGEPVALAADGPRVVLALDGEACLLTGAGELRLRRGGSCFVPDAAGPLTVDGAAHVVCAWVP